MRGVYVEDDLSSAAASRTEAVASGLRHGLVGL
jgi:hypothetical protein